MKRTVTLVILVFSTFSFAPLSAGVVPGHWDKVSVQERGIGLVVSLKSGDTIRCQLGELRPEELSLLCEGQERLVPKSEVSRILTQDTDDGKKDGTLLGVVVGTLGGVVLGAIATTKDDVDGNTAAASAGGAAMGAGIGAAIGYAADSARHSPTLLYKAP